MALLIGSACSQLFFSRCAFDWDLNLMIMGMPNFIMEFLDGFEDPGDLIAFALIDVPIDDSQHRTSAPSVVG